jgi:hypothetical protein
MPIDVAPVIPSTAVSRLFPDARPGHPFGLANQPVPLEASQKVQDSAVAHAKGIAQLGLSAWTFERRENIAASLLGAEGVSASPTL